MAWKGSRNGGSEQPLVGHLKVTNLTSNNTNSVPLHLFEYLIQDQNTVGDGSFIKTPWHHHLGWITKEPSSRAEAQVRAKQSRQLAHSIDHFPTGINLAFAKAIHAKGCAVLIGDIALHSEAVEWLNSTERDVGPKVLFQQTDVTAWEQLERLFDVFAKEFGGAPDVVVAGAGIYEASSAGFWNDRDEASHYKLLDINLVHPIKLTRIAIRRLRQANKPGVILHESSIVALKPSPVLPLYAVSKAALSHFVRCMAPLGEMSGIKVVAVAPGSVGIATI